MSTASTPALLQPIKVGALDLSHRVVLAPLTRFRAGKKTHVPVVPLVKEYYTQRATKPGTLLVTEATIIAPKAGGFDNSPGIWSKEQISAWKEVTDSVHAKGSYIFNQIWAVGRSAHPSVLKEDGQLYLAPSPIPFTTSPNDVPREMTIDEIHEFVEHFAQAAKNAIEAGFDGVEIHGANGYLIDEFLQDVTNQRTDEYGGNIESRSRFGLEVVDAVVKAIGAERVGIRLSPWTKYYEMGMKDPIPQFAHFVSSLKNAQPDLAYLHVTEVDLAHPDDDIFKIEESIDFIRAIWKPKTFISAGGYKRHSALRRAEETGNLVALGRWFLANPDIVDRIENDIPFTKYNRDTFYTPAESPDAAKGYVDYTFWTTKDV
ncbi:hypothetical protein BDQ17DRAFT_1248838 [Cyathus striatus]|nr:hypothetical protein BDQ17DRAFT_1248838 [Cyathus striatus]